MGYFGQEADPIDEMLAAPAHVDVAMSLFFVSVAMAKQAADLAAAGNSVAANMAMQAEYPAGVPNPKSAFGLWNYASKTLESLLLGKHITKSLFDSVSSDLEKPALTLIQQADEVVKRQNTSAWARMWGTGIKEFEAKADVFLKKQADKYVRLYKGIDVRNKSVAALVNSIKAKASALPNAAQALPILEKDLNTGRQAQTALETAFAETQITPAMLRGEQALGQWGTVVVRNLDRLKFTKLASMLGPTFAKLGLSATKSLWATKIIYWASRPLVLIFSKAALKYAAAMGAGAYITAWIFSKGSEDYAHYGGSPLAMVNDVIGKAKKDKELAIRNGDKPAERDADIILAQAEETARKIKESSDSAKTDFPGEAALLDQGTGDTTWVLYALGGGALAIGLYLYFNRKSQIVS
jgi:hypothetical protein